MKILWGKLFKEVGLCVTAPIWLPVALVVFFIWTLIDAFVEECTQSKQ